MWLNSCSHQSRVEHHSVTLMRANRVMCVLGNSKCHHRYILWWIDSRFKTQFSLSLSHDASAIYQRKRISDMNTRCGSVIKDKQHQRARAANDMIQKSLQSRWRTAEITSSWQSAVEKGEYSATRRQWIQSSGECSFIASAESIFRNICVFMATESLLKPRTSSSLLNSFHFTCREMLQCKTMCEVKMSTLLSSPSHHCCLQLSWVFLIMHVCI